MSLPVRTPRLTAELAALCHRHVEDPGTDGIYDYFTEDDYRAVVERLLDERPPGPFRVFAYASLIWKPEFVPAERIRAKAHGWHRAFSLEVQSYRGSPMQPGYMLCLDRGGTCEGVALSLGDGALRDDLFRLVYREIGSHEAMSGVRWIDLDAGGRQLRALTFYAAPDGLDHYRAGRPVADVVRALSLSCGHWGSGADYLRSTVVHLEDMGIHDPHLWDLQEQVAAEIESRHARGRPQQVMP